MFVNLKKNLSQGIARQCDVDVVALSGKHAR